MEIVNCCAEDKKSYPNGFAPCIEKEREENQHGVSECSVFSGKIEYQVDRKKEIEKKQVCKYHIFVIRPCVYFVYVMSFLCELFVNAIIV